MGSGAEEESSCILKLPLFSVSHAQKQSPGRSGTLTPPFYVSAASVPFRWEEEPGKPKPLSTFCSTPNESDRKCLELPPRLLQDAKLTKLSSPTTVLEGPYVGSRRARFQSSSFRMGSECYGSFRSAGSASPETMVLSKRGFLGSWRRRTLKGRPRREVCGNSYVFAASDDGDSECSRDRGEDRSVKIHRITRIGSFPNFSHSKSHFWESVYESLMQVVPWSKREKKDRFMG
ncbi:maternal effect embryo arrest 47 [Hibiscus trionum]|uniref:Maternal effect embryo arrest 47 n=1 Tax=Hibiscus trionum TaxID=183268 RepID=A0A9W7MC93_HIBTR|nr:maternal effect embryo arrest 47 [Hibiscus trionum]